MSELLKNILALYTYKTGILAVFKLSRIGELENEPR